MRNFYEYIVLPPLVLTEHISYLATNVSLGLGLAANIVQAVIVLVKSHANN